MSRFIAGHFWLVVSLLLVIGRDPHTRYSNGSYYSVRVFGWGEIEPPLYWLVTLTAATIGFVSLILGRRPDDALVGRPIVDPAAHDGTGGPR